MSVKDRLHGSFERASGGGNGIKPPDLIMKELVIEKWSKGGLERPVKVVSLERGPQSSVRGYITQEKNVKDQPLAELERRLGLPKGELASGAYIIALDRLPKPHEFELRSYTNLPGGQTYQRGGKYPPGTGVPQWELTVDIPSTTVKVVSPGHTVSEGMHHKISAEAAKNPLERKALRRRI
jgi:hypothetical protein